MREKILPKKEKSGSAQNVPVRCFLPFASTLSALLGARRLLGVVREMGYGIG